MTCILSYIHYVQCCWNCGRTASETCSGCRRARYCGTFCQHRHWRSHHRSCHPVALDPATARGTGDKNTPATEALVSGKTTSPDPPPGRFVDDEGDGVRRVQRETPIGDPDRRLTPATRTWHGDDGRRGDAARGCHRSSQRRRKYRRADVAPARDDDDDRTATVTSTAGKHPSGRRALPAGGLTP